jgi:hypothetical protein
MHHTPCGRSVTYDSDTLKKLEQTFDRALGLQLLATSQAAPAMQRACSSRLILEFAAETVTICSS